MKQKKCQHVYCENTDKMVYGDVRIPELIAFGMTKDEANDMRDLLAKGHPDRKYFVYPIKR